jgi:hypothetical protein
LRQNARGGVLIRNGSSFLAPENQNLVAGQYARKAAAISAPLSRFGHVHAMNIHRRHLDQSQRALIGEKMATMKHGGDRKSHQAANLQFECLHINPPMIFKSVPLKGRHVKSVAHQTTVMCAS